MAEDNGSKKPQETRIAIPKENAGADDEASDRPVDKPSTLSPVSVPQEDIDKALRENSQDDIAVPGVVPPAAGNSPAQKAASAAASMLTGNGGASSGANPPKNSDPAPRSQPQNDNQREFWRLIAPGAAIYAILILIIIIFLAQAVKWYRSYREKQAFAKATASLTSKPASSSPADELKIICTHDSNLRIEQGTLLAENCRSLSREKYKSKWVSCLDKPVSYDAEGNRVYSNCVLIDAPPFPVEQQVVCGKGSTLSVKGDTIVFQHCDRSPSLIAELEKNQSMNRRITCVNAQPSEEPNGNLTYTGCIRE